MSRFFQAKIMPQWTLAADSVGYSLSKFYTSTMKYMINTSLGYGPSWLFFANLSDCFLWIIFFGRWHIRWGTIFRRQIVTGLVSEKKIQYINKSINIILTKCWDTILFQSINQISADKNQVVGIVSCWFRYNLCQLHNLYQFYPLCVVIVIACHHFYIN